MAKNAILIPVNRRAAMARIKRELKRQGKKLHNDRRDRQSTFALIDEHKGVVLTAEVDLEKLGHELGVLKKWETLAAEE